MIMTSNSRFSFDRKENVVRVSGRIQEGFLLSIPKEDIHPNPKVEMNCLYDNGKANERILNLFKNHILLFVGKNSRDIDSNIKRIDRSKSVLDIKNIQSNYMKRFDVFDFNIVIHV